MKQFIVSVVFFMLMVPVASFGEAEIKQLKEVSHKERCPVCGMFVHKYPDWLVQLRQEDGKVYMFDGVKDMLAFYFAPEDFGVKGGKVTDIIVKDYYTQQWIDGFKAYYVTGNENVFGPMGHEFIPFETQAAAENFYKDHRGKKILQFSEISHQLVHNMRGGQGEVKGGGGHGAQGGHDMKKK